MFRFIIKTLTAGFAIQGMLGAASNKRDLQPSAVAKMNPDGVTFPSSQAAPFLLSTSPICVEIPPDEYFSKTQQCEPISREKLGKLITGEFTPAQKEAVITAIIEVSQADPAIAAQIKIVLNHLPGFRIILLAELPRHLKEGAELRGSFSTLSHTLVLPTQLSVDILYSSIRHEFRHALWYILQRHFIDPTISTACWIPDTEAERKKFENLFNEEGKKIISLFRLLAQETQATIAPEEQQYLDRLRKRLTTTQKFYNRVFTVDRWNDQIKAGRQQTVSWTPSSIINDSWYNHNELRGIKLNVKINVLSVTKEKVSYTIEDPLISALQAITINDLHKVYLETELPYEKDAFLVGEIPAWFREELFPKATQYMQNLIDQISLTSSFYQQPGRDYSNVEDFIHEQEILRTTNSAFFSEENLPQVFYAAQKLYEMKDFPNSKKALLAYLNKTKTVSDQSLLANVMLGDIFAKEKNFEEANNYAWAATKQVKDGGWSQWITFTERLFQGGEPDRANKLKDYLLRELENPRWKPQTRKDRQAHAELKSRLEELGNTLNIRAGY